MQPETLSKATTVDDIFPTFLLGPFAMGIIGYSLVWFYNAGFISSPVGRPP